MDPAWSHGPSLESWTNSLESWTQPGVMVCASPHVAVAVGAEPQGPLLVGDAEAVEGVGAQHQEEVKHLGRAGLTCYTAGRPGQHG